MHNVTGKFPHSFVRNGQNNNYFIVIFTADQIEKNKQLIGLVKGYPQIYNHDPAQQQSSGESVEEIWAKIGQELQESRKLSTIKQVDILNDEFSHPHS